MKPLIDLFIDRSKLCFKLYAVGIHGKCYCLYNDGKSCIVVNESLCDYFCNNVDYNQNEFLSQFFINL